MSAAALETHALEVAAPAVRCRDLVHVYGTVGSQVAALRGVDLTIGRGESVALIGPSGSGKTTLLWHIAGLLQPSAGSVEVAGVNPASLSAAGLTRFRRRTVGIVLQGPPRNVLPYEPALGNVTYAAMRRLGQRRTAHSDAVALLDAVGLPAHSRRPAGRMSGGEQQRLAIAIALVNHPVLLLADEPTSQLDHHSADQVVTLLRDVAAERNTTVLTVSHDPAVTAGSAVSLSIHDGRISALGTGGRQYPTVGAGGAVQLPPEVLAELPAGSQVEITPEPGGAHLRRVR